MVTGFLNFPWFLWALLAFLLAAVWIFVWPRAALRDGETSGLRYFLVRWGHALTWDLLALSFFLRGIGPELNGGSSFFALAGGVMYMMFLAMMFVAR